jgi:hypothetical protein
MTRADPENLPQSTQRRRNITLPCYVTIRPHR